MHLRAAFRLKRESGSGAARRAFHRSVERCLGVNDDDTQRGESRDGAISVNATDDQISQSGASDSTVQVLDQDKMRKEGSGGDDVRKGEKDDGREQETVEEEKRSRTDQCREGATRRPDDTKLKISPLSLGRAAKRKSGRTTGFYQPDPTLITRQEVHRQQEAFPTRVTAQVEGSRCTEWMRLEEEEDRRTDEQEHYLSSCLSDKVSPKGCVYLLSLSRQPGDEERSGTEHIWTGLDLLTE
ncbi:hypothetical protein F2P81_017633 [Scophthalmus maximus]|uniref:Uncharacterized protein n=1 Tax=Scophthalmus maximus TaxID=52904 RepID=A0A6A4SKL6_SCOMX|nr:hypothetical protein F2P81_017633 [Scophthalmus maximus]